LVLSIKSGGLIAPDAQGMLGKLGLGIPREYWSALCFFSVLLPSEAIKNQLGQIN
jgi:hypothetical protein